MRQFDLYLAVPGRRAPGKDVENQLAAIEHPEFEPLTQVARLGRGEILVEDDEVDVALERQHHQILQLAPADDGLWIYAIAILGEDVADGDVGSPREFAQFV